MRLHRLLVTLGLLGSSFIFHSGTGAQDVASPANPSAEAASPAAPGGTNKTDKPTKKPNTAVAEIAAFKITAELEATVDSPAKLEVAIRPKSLKEFKLVGVAGHGQRVARGQLVLQLDSEPLERALRAAQQAVTSAESDLKQAGESLKSLDQALKLELEAAVLANDRSQDDLDHFLREGRAQQIDDLEYSIVSAQQSVEYSREEYEQLKKMYDADELTEESEEIVLKRALNDLKRTERFLKATERRVKRQLEVEIDRQQANLKNTAAKSSLELEKLKLAQDSKRIAAKLAVGKAEAGLEAAQKDLKNLHDDRQLLAVTAPFPGIVFFGTVNNQAWKGTAGSEELQTIGGQLQANRTLLTIVSSEKLFVRANTPERLKNLLRPGVAASFEPTSDSGLRLPVICDEQADIPQEPGSYRTAFRFDRPNLANDLLPLMTGKLISTLYEKENALLIPVEAVRYEGAEAFVEIFSPETNVTRRQEVQLGNKDAKRIEITSGLREGEHVVMP